MNLADQAPEPLATQETLPVNSQTQRLLAIAQQAKDTITIILMLGNGMLIFGALAGIALPGLVLYVIRWRQVMRYRRSSASIWVLSLLHELACMALFVSDHPLHSNTESHFEAGYLLGAVICLLALCDLGWGRLQEDEDETVPPQ